MIAFRSSVLALMLALPAFGDTPATRQWVLATAKATGVGGAKFVSSLRIVNPEATEANVTLTYFPQSPISGAFSATGDNTNASSAAVRVPGGEMLAIEDVIGSLFGGAGPFGIVAGGIRVDSDQPVSVLSRTYVSNAVSSTGVAGTYGLSIPAQVVDQAIAVGDTAYMPYIAASPNQTSGFRCNFIMLNTAGSTAVVSVALKRQDGTLVGQRSYTLGNFSAAQQGDIAASFGYARPDQDLFLTATVTSGGPVVVGTSIIDNAISSLNYAPPTKTVGSFKDGSYGIVFAQDPNLMTGRIDLLNGNATYIAFAAAPNSCAYFFGLYQDVPSSDGGGTTFTREPDGSITFSGQDTSSPQVPGDPAAWNGTIQFTNTGISGTLIYSLSSKAKDCAGTSVSYEFAGTWLAAPSF